ncbi:MAG TPA: purine-nucleoside phosphorylase [Caldithrix abyssi]|uniref:Purine nucleoside phosphorylase n=1 Tax=Caldithrix abyssi TaxID=187145 RepID=A0A7V1LN61_CALAY|nr:purine-nucleoside phosphorylase [Caldithrix abyssi]
MRFNIEEYRATIKAAANHIQKQLDSRPGVGIILGTGLGKLADEVDVKISLPYDEIPGFPVSTVESHAGRLIYGQLGGKNVLAMQGRFHYYEGYAMHQITLPVRVMYELGIRTLFVSNAGGVLNPHFDRGDIMVLDDHINLLGDNPLIGPNLDEYGPRFPDMSEPYDKELIALAEEVALEQKLNLRKGVYVAVQGPNLETRAEYRFLRAIGADVVGMSTVPEAIVANHMGMKTLAFSVITDECYADALQAVSLEEIIATAAKAEPKLTALMQALIARI